MSASELSNEVRRQCVELGRETGRDSMDMCDDHYIPPYDDMSMSHHMRGYAPQLKRLRNRELKRRDIEDASNDMKARVGLAVVDAFREGFRETSLSEKEGCHECLFDDDSPLEIRVEDIPDLSDISK